ncbi:thiolase family protein [Nocardioides sp. HDW12B]|uniref:thiolase family protein n=1 Tax=Nocardioides sp. HDW12B TaxID=2714939 RepID=UPI001F0DB491|nr:thiolase family protein [Nocardioides sp. HDW12B]
MVDALRTPIGTAGRGLASLTAADLAAPVLSALVDRLPAGAGAVHEVVLGNCMGPGGDVARVATLQAGLEPATLGWGRDVPAVTVDRQCASGLAAVVQGAATLTATPGPGVVLAGGVESASTAPWRFWPPGPDATASGSDAPTLQRYERAPFAPAALGDPDMGVANDLLAAEAGVTRAEQDGYAARSHARAVATAAAGGFDAELVLVGGLARDERPRDGLGVERLARLRPAFREDGTVTAGNSCGINDGAAAATLVTDDVRRSLGLPGLRIRSTATVAFDPDRPGHGLVPATRLALERAGVGLADLAVVELNEAFAGQVLACCRALALDPERVCPEGGALALGHPWGASGSVLVVRLFSQLVRSGRGGLGLAAIAAGGGQGVAVVVEAVA